jgi:hypothetical protein
MITCDELSTAKVLTKLTLSGPKKQTIYDNRCHDSNHIRIYKINKAKCNMKVNIMYVEDT